MVRFLVPVIQTYSVQRWRDLRVLTLYSHCDSNGFYASQLLTAQCASLAHVELGCYSITHTRARAKCSTYPLPSLSTRDRYSHMQFVTRYKDLVLISCTPVCYSHISGHRWHIIGHLVTGGVWKSWWVIRVAQSVWINQWPEKKNVK